MKKLVFGVGNNDLNGCSKDISYNIWLQMLYRCYNNKKQLLSPSYIGCTVHNDWLTFSNYKQWFDLNYIEDYHIDKDIKTANNKVYGPDTCIVVSNNINLWFRQKKYDYFCINKIFTSCNSGICFRFRTTFGSIDVFDYNGDININGLISTIKNYIDSKEKSILESDDFKNHSQKTRCIIINRLIDERKNFEVLIKENYYKSDEFKQLVKDDINEWLDQDNNRNVFNNIVSGNNLKRLRSKSKQLKFNNIIQFLK